MDSKMLVAGIEIPPEDWEKTPASVKALIKQLENRLVEIEERVGLTSKNSSIPPSSDPPRKKKENSSSRKPGARKGHKGFGRNLYPVSECSEVIEHKPSRCKHCNHALSGVDTHPYRHQIVEIPPMKLEVLEHRLHALKCPSCGRQTRAELPSGVNPTGYGERLQGIVGLLCGSYRLSHRSVKTLLWELWGVGISIGSLNRIRSRVSQQVSGIVAAARTYVKSAPLVYVDETRWQQQNNDGNNPEGQQGWLWVASAGVVSVYQVTLNRRGSSARELLGSADDGIVVSDRYSGYNWLRLEQRQLCWAHLKRDFQRIAERQGASAEIGEALLALTRRLFRWWHRVRDGTLSRERFQEAVAHLRQRFQRLLAEAAALCDSPQEKTPLAKTARTCASLLKVEPALWTFVEHEGIEPTNNTAEQALRTAVIWRRLSFGSHSATGSEFVARMLTVVTTLRSQGRCVLDFLIRAIRSEAVSLLPLPSQ